MPPAADDYLRVLQSAVDGVSYPSESDEPFEVLTWDETSASARDVLLAHVDRKRAIEQTSIDAFFLPLNSAENADQFQQLRRILETVLRDLAIFRVGSGEVRVDIYLVGRAPNGGWAALHTVSVET